MIRIAANAVSSAVLWASCFAESEGLLARALVQLAARVYEGTRDHE